MNIEEIHQFTIRGRDHAPAFVCAVHGEIAGKEALRLAPFMTEDERICAKCFT